MKKNYIYLLMAMCFLYSNYSNAQTTFKLDSIYQYSWDNGLNDWKHNTKDIYTYANGGTKETNLLRLSLNGVDWENFYQYNKLYNGNNDLTESILQNWDGNNWQNGSRDSYTYDASNNEETYAYAIYTGPNWLTFNENFYTYNGLDNITEDLSTAYDFINMMMVNDERQTYFYDANNRLDFEIKEEWNTSWSNSERKEYSYNVDDKIILTELRAWSVSIMEWGSPYRQTIFSYDNNLITEVIEQVIVSESWVNSTKIMNTYDTNGNLLEILGQEWNSSVEQWENSYRQLRTFDVNNNETELIYETWNASTSQWEGFLRMVKYWSIVGALNLDKFFSINDKIKVYPNPVSGILNIESKFDIQSINLFNLQSREVIQVNGEAPIDLSHFQSGIYLLKISTRKGEAVKKILVD
ncbi:T9SS type A sorting domain-containing protein [Flavobacteriaceae bacterium SZ-1-7]|uniref:T9SS type A sorting domain-containing protein n=1 Tax=Tamlana sedimenti TaxID=3134126 RepID=UPI003128CE75